MAAGPPTPDAPVPCPVCGLGVPPADYDRHLRREHDVVVYRGVRRPLAETLDAIRFDLNGDPPSDAAWQALRRLAAEDQPKPDKWLAGWLAESWGRLAPPRRVAQLDRVRPLIAPGNDRLIARLAARPEPFARRFALEAVPADVPATLEKAVKALLTDRTLDEPSQRRVVRDALDRQPRLARRALRWFTAGLTRKEALARLGRLVAGGGHELIDAAAERIGGERRLACPRCGVNLRRDAMERHLWDSHRLLLEGLAVREPWEVVGEWAARYRATRDAAWLERCKAAAVRLDPDGGAARLERVLLANGVGDPLVLKALLARAKDEHAGCCPGCFALVPVPRETPPLEVNLRPGRLSAGGYEVITDERGVSTRVRVVSPREVVYEGPEPEQRRTPRGLILLAAGPFAGLALLAAVAWPWPPLPVVLLLLLGGAVAGLFAWLIGQYERSAERRAFDDAWARLVPTLHPGGYDAQDSRFLAGLARLASRREWVDVPDGALETALTLTLRTLEQKRAAPSHLAALCRLRAEAAAGRGQDPVALVEKWAASAFEGKLPLAFVQHLLVEWQADFWTPGQLARLRLRLRDRAFEAGFEVQGLLDAGRNAPALGAVLLTDAPRRLAALRLLWSLRAARPWDRFGDARTAFDLAAVPSRIELFERHPDLILWQQPGAVLNPVEDGATPQPATVQLTLAGVWLNEELFATPPTVIETRQRVKGVEVRIGNAVFRTADDADGLTRLMERWFRWAFHEFLPNVDRAREWVSASRTAVMRAWGASACPECGRYLLARVGEVGVALEERT